MDNRLIHDVNTVLQAALAAGEPHRLVQQAMANASLARAETSAVAVLAIGKAAPKMYSGFTAVAGEPGSRMVLTTAGVEAPDWVLLGDHPVPTTRNIAAAEQVAAFVQRERDRGRGFVVMLSGGTSALLTLPAKGLHLDDVQQVTRMLLASGAEIGEINCVRRHIEQLKGGRLAALMAPARVEAMALSDVIGDDPAAIGSGPVSPDPNTFAQAREIVARRAPAATGILAFLEAGERGEHQETPKPQADGGLFEHARFRIIGNNALIVKAVCVAAQKTGYRLAHVVQGVTIDASEAGRRLARLAIDVRRGGGTPACVVFGGETTVSLGKGHGRGGRNQEMALAAAIELDAAGRAGGGIAIGTLATDGVDGPTDAAGAIITGESVSAAKRAGFAPLEHLAKHDSHPVFDAIGALIRTGPTGTNVNDVAVALIS